MRKSSPFRCGWTQSGPSVRQRSGSSAHSVVGRVRLGTTLTWHGKCCKSSVFGRGDRVGSTLYYHRRHTLPVGFRNRKGTIFRRTFSSSDAWLADLLDRFAKYWLNSVVSRGFSGEKRLYSHDVVARASTQSARNGHSEVWG